MESTERLELLADPDCEYCHGEGWRFWHQPGCSDPNCTLDGGFNDCLGQMERCPCTQRALNDMRTARYLAAWWSTTKTD